MASPDWLRSHPRLNGVTVAARWDTLCEKLRSNLDHPDMLTVEMVKEMETHPGEFKDEYTPVNNLGHAGKLTCDIYRVGGFGMQPSHDHLFPDLEDGDILPPQPLFYCTKDDIYFWRGLSCTRDYNTLPKFRAVHINTKKSVAKKLYSGQVNVQDLWVLKKDSELRNELIVDNDYDGMISAIKRYMSCGGLERCDF